MITRSRLTIPLFLIASLLMSGRVYGQENRLAKEEILRAIRSGSTYAANVLLDEEGKSRCDYNVREGKWYPFEEPWYTGQLINALVDVYKLTRDTSSRWIGGTERVRGDRSRRRQDTQDPQ